MANASEVTQQPKAVFWALALGGLIPFVFLATAVVAGIDLGFGYAATTLFIFWSLAILSFLGGIRWGLALAQKPADFLVAIISVLPCIAGLFSLLLEPRITILCLGVLFVFHGWWDTRYFSKTDLEWFSVLRFVLTILVAIIHLAVFWKLT